MFALVQARAASEMEKKKRRVQRAKAFAVKLALGASHFAFRIVA